MYLDLGGFDAEEPPMRSSLFSDALALDDFCNSSSIITPPFDHQQPHPHHHQTTLQSDPIFPTTHTPSIGNDAACAESRIYAHAFALLQQSRSEHSTTPPNLRNDCVHPPTAQLVTHQAHRRPKKIQNNAIVAHRWCPQPMYAAQYHNLGGPIQGIKRSRSHHRTPSTSTVASTGSASPYMHSPSYTHISNSEHEPHSPAPFADQCTFATNIPTPSQTPVLGELSNTGYAPSAAVHIPNAHLAMKHFGFDYHQTDDFTPDFAPSRQSMSSYGNDSPATPQSGADVDASSYNIQQNDYKRNNPQVQLFRTESAAFQDELYNPNQVYTSAPAKSAPAPSNSLLSPQRNLISERLQTANLARSGSYAPGVDRDRSPFRDGSPLAPSKEWKVVGPSDGRVGTAASIRQRQKDAATEAEYARNRVPLRREATNTISPKDALLDYTDNDQQPLFHDTLPTGYKQHFGGSEQWPSNDFMQPGSDFVGLSSAGTQNVGFRTATPAEAFSGVNFDFSAMPTGNGQIAHQPFQANYQAAVAAKMNHPFEATPPFPPTMPSMESSLSDTVVPQSSQESNDAGTTVQRPNDTRANTGTYTCTYHGCTHRFTSHAELQTHKRDQHRSQQRQYDPASPTGTGTGTTTGTVSSASPRSSASPDPTAGMTSAAILARNSQAGPHKCTRINPSTGKPCNTIFSRPYDLTRHEDTIHNNRKQKVRCPMCREEKTFSRNDALTRHMRVVHPEVESYGKRSRRD